MIFSGKNPDGKKHFDMVLDGSKTRTTRLSGRYKVGKDYAIQPKRTKRGIDGYRIVIDKKREERRGLTHLGVGFLITPKDAKAEGGYSSEEFEEVFKRLFPKWDGSVRWSYEFHIIEVRRNVPGITSHTREEKLERTLKHLHQEITEHIHPYVTTKIEKVLK